MTVTELRAALSALPASWDYAEVSVQGPVQAEEFATGCEPIHDSSFGCCFRINTVAGAMVWPAQEVST